MEPDFIKEIELKELKTLKTLKTLKLQIFRFKTCGSELKVKVKLNHRFLLINIFET